MNKAIKPWMVALCHCPYVSSFKCTVNGQDVFQEGLSECHNRAVYRVVATPDDFICAKNYDTTTVTHGAARDADETSQTVDKKIKKDKGQSVALEDTKSGQVKTEDSHDTTDDANGGSIAGAPKKSKNKKNKKKRR